MAKATVTELEVLFTANTQQVDTAAKKVQDQADKIEKKPVDLKVDGDARGALAAMDRVEAEAKKIVSAKTMATVDANIDRAQTSLGKVQERLDYLRSVETTMEVTGDIKRAEAALKQIERRRDGLVSAKSTMEVDANTAPAEAALDDVAGEAADAGGRGGDDAGANLVGGILGALATIPIAGAVVGIGQAAGEALLDGFNDGLQVEARQDRLQALTGISEDEAARLGRAAGESYADVFGESIEANMDTARIAVQSGLLDPASTTRQSEEVISSLAGIADVLGEDVQPIAFAVTRLLQTGLAKTADEAFDLLATGAREGVNASDDLIDTFTEYPALFERLGLSGEEALGLINQGLEGGARNSDLAADALKEFQIRASTDLANATIGFEGLGLSVEDSMAAVAAGGEPARDVLAEVLDGLREMEPGFDRTAVAAALFGTQAEDLGDALTSMDLSTAVDGLNGVEGAAQAMFDTIAGNDASEIQEAQRNVEVAADGMKGALAAAFSEPLGDLAEFVAENRGPIMSFLLDLANGGLEFGRSFIESTALATESAGQFVAGPLADMVEGIAGLIDGLDPLTTLFTLVVPGFEMPESNLQELADEMRGFDETTQDAADQMRENLLPGIDEAQDRLNEFGIPVVNQAYFHDASLALAASIEQVGYAADGTTQLVDAYTVAQDGTVGASASLQSQIEGTVAALDQEAISGAAAGESQASLTERYEEGRGALIDQLEAMGLTEAQAAALTDQYGAVPGRVDTVVSSNAVSQTEDVGNLAYEIRTLPDGSVEIVASTGNAQRTLDTFVSRADGRSATVTVNYRTGSVQSFQNQGSSLIGMHDGGVLEFMAGGGLRPMTSVAQHVDPNTWRVVGDRADVRESYIPHDGSARSMAILLETMRLMGVQPMAAGGITDTTPPGASASVTIPITVTESTNPQMTAMEVRSEIERVLAEKGQVLA